MYYTTVKKPKHLDEKILDKCISFANDYLDLDIDFEIHFKKLKEFQYGLCDYDEDEIIIIISKSLSEHDIIRTIFHELVHIKQYEDGRLKPGYPQLWFGKEYNCSYENLPWEVEAYSLEKKMIMEWKNTK